jgi:hypothetical protein|tara:strand:- start:385 stop:1950 length:1566 start_codon:yes stop_codon:yes gene_type:complete
MATLFGFEIKRESKDQTASFAPLQLDDGAHNVSTGGMYGTYVDLEGATRTEAELITRYRRMSMQPECDMAIDDIIHEFIVYDERNRIVDINLDMVQGLSASTKKIIQKEFEYVLDLLEFNEKGYEVARHWYIDGRMFYHIIVDPDNVQDGIQELRYIDPRKIKKVRENKKERIPGTQVQVERHINEFFLYNDKGFVGYPGGSPTSAGQDQGVKIAKDTILHCTSGVMSEDNRLVLSHLHKAIKPLNQLRILEDATVIYRIARAPERRIFYIDVGNLPKMKAEQYLRDMMVKHKNRLIYDAATGEIRDDRKFMTMLEDYWLPRREGGRGTEITTLPGGQNLGEMDDVLYFQKKMFKSLNVPVSRLEPETGMTLGRATEINRDEVKFQKFIQRLRMRFSMLFDGALEKQLVLKGHMTPEEFNEIRRDIKYDFKHDNYFSELKEDEILNARINTANALDGFVGKYFSVDWVKRNVFKMTEDEIEKMQGEMDDEADQSTEMDAALADPADGTNGIDGEQGPPSDG